MKGLTKRQKEILVFIERYQEENGVSPSMRDIGSYFKISVKGAYDHVIALEKKKYILRERKKKIARNILINKDKLDFNLNSERINHWNELNKTTRIMEKFPKAKECIVCGNKNDIHRHHEDYNKPEKYLELCRKHHLLLHSWKKKLKKHGFILKIHEKK